MRFISVGGDNYVALDKIKALSSPKSSSVKGLVRVAKAKDMCVDYTSGKRTMSVLLMIDDSIVLSPISAKTLVGRFNKESSEIMDEGKTFKTTKELYDDLGI
ncbi:MAG: DUF370 domain-containing protein [Prevotella sp.]|nr:DUF370 domain-containing protein [Prevotella sp.]